MLNQSFQGHGFKRGASVEANVLDMSQFPAETINLTFATQACFLRKPLIFEALVSKVFTTAVALGRPLFQ